MSFDTLGLHESLARALSDAGYTQPTEVQARAIPPAMEGHDLMVSSSLSADMAKRLPNARLTIYPDSGHGGVFQHHETFVPAVLRFLAD